MFSQHSKGLWALREGDALKAVVTDIGCLLLKEDGFLIKYIF